MEIKRIFIDRGHGLNNETPGKFDPGALGGIESEASLCSFMAGALAGGLNAIYGGDNVVLVPELSRAGVVSFVNFAAEPGDILISLHMNSSANPKAKGTEVIVGSNAPTVRSRQALILADAFASNVGLVSRGSKKDSDIPAGNLTILRDTKIPAFLLEMGFISNALETEMIVEKGPLAIVAAVETLRTKG